MCACVYIHVYIYIYGHVIHMCMCIYTCDIWTCVGSFFRGGYLQSLSRQTSSESSALTIPTHTMVSPATATQRVALCAYIYI